MLSLIFNFLINFGVAFTFPLFISIGTILGIPVNAFVDLAFRHVTLTWYDYVGCAVIMVGFGLLLIPVQQERSGGEDVTDVHVDTDRDKNRGGGKRGSNHRGGRWSQ